MLPEVRNSSEIYGTVNLSGVPVPIAGVAGDQQAALFGQTCFDKGDAKNTYGTGCFLLMNTGDGALHLQERSGFHHRHRTERHRCSYALEGSVFVGGAVVQWLRDEMRFIISAKDSEYFATSVEDNGGVYVVPAFTGSRRAPLGYVCPGRHRRPDPRHQPQPHHPGFAGVHRLPDQGCARRHGSRIPAAAITSLRADGGASANNFLMQFQSDIIGCLVTRPRSAESTALGAAYLAGLAVGFWSGLDEAAAECPDRPHL